MFRSGFLALLLPLFALTFAPAAAIAAGSEPCATSPLRDGPSAVGLVGVGALMAVPNYFLWVTLHEGSHAVAAKAFGAEITEFSILPDRASNGSLRFGHSKHSGGLTTGQNRMVALAPKLTGLAALGTYAVLLETDNLPENKWAQLGLLVFTIGALADFSKDVTSTNPANDTVRVYEMAGATTEAEKLPLRLLHGAIAIGGAIEVGRGVYRLFALPEPPSSAPKPPKPPTQGLTPIGSPIIMPESIGWSVNL